MTPRPFIPIPRGVKAELRYTWAGQQVENVLNFLSTNPANEEILIDIAAHLTDWATSELLPLLGNDITLNYIKLTALDSADAPTYTSTNDLPATGGHGVPSVPNNVALCAKLCTPHRGRSSTGRMYIPALPNNIVVGNGINTEWMGLMRGALNALSGYMILGNARWSVASYVAGKVLRAVGVLNEINSVTIDPVVDSQRRRLPGRGR